MDHLVQPAQLGAQRTEESGDGCGFEKGPSPTFTHHSAELPSGNRGVTSFPGLHHHPEPQVGGEHQLHHFQSPAEDVFPAAAK